MTALVRSQGMILAQRHQALEKPILVAEDQDGRRLGFLTISCQRHYTGLAEAYIRNLAVLEQAQRLGVGTHSGH